MNLKRKTTWICHLFSGRICGIDSILNKKYSDFCWLVVIIQRPDYFPLDLC